MKTRRGVGRPAAGELGISVLRGVKWESNLQGSEWVVCEES
jgi:hypothetical protein